MARPEEFPQLAAQGLKACPIRGDGEYTRSYKTLRFPQPHVFIGDRKLMNSFSVVGNCLFNALSDQVYGDQSRHEEIRIAVINYMRMHPDEFKPFIHVNGERRNPKRKVTRSASKIEGATEQQTEHTWEGYLKNMKRSGTWGGHLEITAFTRSYNYDIQIFEVDKTLYHRAQFDKIHRPVAYIAYHVGVLSNSQINLAPSPLARRTNYSDD